ncbi:M48 family metallopeptidase [Hahella sp. HN01]|uniref:M48 family metallopeptidase n=1 Tax=Hahella sp. HN01 TaxID=2847262 RepID=UPI001C1EFDF1|nr:M48 family metallopeptidase [Hahella sp. HN01]MBU6950628.1 M48 family metalloprotease [Hahella sp. HN01]
MSAPASPQFNVISQGKILSGFEERQVRDNLVARLKLSNAQVERLLTGAVVIKKSLSSSDARKYQALFVRLGLAVTLQPCPSEEVATKPVQPASTEAAQPAKSSAPSTASRAKPAKDADIQRDVLALAKERLHQPIPKLPVTTAYKLGLFSVTLLSLIAPLIYISLTICAIVGTIWYGMSIPDILAVRKTNAMGTLMVFVPVLLGTVFALFLLKPFFGRDHENRTLELNPKKYRRFYQLVQLLTERMGLPAPVKIYVDGEVNAHVAPEKGLLSLFQGRLTLTVGLPLLAGMNSRQFIGVLGHEFGHFAQRNAMIANYIVNTANAWMASRAFYPDAWDRRLSKWREYSPIFALDVALIAAQGMIKGTRLILKYLFLFNLRVTRWMSREMEYDADRYESWVAGSETFQSTAVALWNMSMSQQRRDEIWQSAWNEDRLIDNLPQTIAQLAAELSQEEIDAVRAKMDERQTNVWDTHPADNDRIAHAESLGYEPVWTDEFPATELMPDFDALCKIVTLRIYNSMGLEKPEQYLCSFEEIRDVHSKMNESEEALKRYFADLFSMRLMKPFNATPTEVDLAGAVTELRGQIPRATAQMELYWEAYQHMEAAQVGLAYVEAGYNIDAADFGVKAGDISSVQRSLDDRRTEVKRMAGELSRCLDAYVAQRMHLAMAQMSADDKARAESLYNTFRQLFLLRDIWDSLPLCMAGLNALYRQDEEERPKFFAQAAARHVQLAREYLRQFHQISANIDLRFSTSKEQTLAEFAVNWGVNPEEKLDELNAGAIFQISDRCLRVMRYAYRRTISELALQCLQEEEKLGVPPLKVELKAATA